MAPVRSTDDLPNIPPRRSDVVGYFLWRQSLLSQTPNLVNIILLKLCIVVFLTEPISSTGATMFDHIHAIGGISIPTQIIETVVLWVAISVATFHSFGALAYESFEYQAMNRMRPGDRGPRKIDRGIGTRWFEQYSFATFSRSVNSWKASHKTSLTDLVHLLVSNYWLPTRHVSLSF